jgi:hypothetical protein
MHEIVIFWVAAGSTLVAVSLLVAVVCWLVPWLEGTPYIRPMPPAFHMHINLL